MARHMLKPESISIFIESPELEAEMRKIGSSLDVPLVSNQLHGGRTPILSQNKLREIGYRMAIYPTADLLATAYALNNVYGSAGRRQAGAGAAL